MTGRRAEFAAIVVGFVRRSPAGCVARHWRRERAAGRRAGDGRRLGLALTARRLLWSSHDAAVGSRPDGVPRHGDHDRRASAGPKPLAQPTAVDLTRGAKVFAGYCSRCHGADGTGGMGPPLARPRLRRAADDAGIIDILMNGVPGTNMAPAFWLSEREIVQVAAYVRSLGQRPEEALPGDPAGGRDIYARAGCATCHMLNGEGTGIGPDLSDVGAQRGASFLRQSLIDPAAARPERPIPYEPYSYQAYLIVRAQPAEGTGYHRHPRQRRRIHDPDSRPAGPPLAAKARPRSASPQPGTSLMPSYRDTPEGPRARGPGRLPDDAAGGPVRSRAGAPLVVASVLLPALAGAQVPYSRLRAAQSEPDSWLTYSGTYAGHRYSPLAEITPANVAGLRPAWVYQVQEAGQVEATPLVADGVMYITEAREPRGRPRPAHRTHALALRTGGAERRARDRIRSGESRRGAARRSRVRRHARRASRRAGRRVRRRSLGRRRRRQQARLRDHVGAACHRRQGHHRHQRRRSRHSRIP